MRHFSTFLNWRRNTPNNQNPPLTKKRLIAAVAIAIGLGISGSQVIQAQLLGDAIYWSIQLAQMAKHLIQLKATVTALTYAATHFSLKQQFETAMTQLATIPSGGTANNQFDQAIVKFNTLGGTLAAYNSSVLTQTGVNYIQGQENQQYLKGTLDRIDSATPTCMAYLGQYHQNSGLNLKAIWALAKSTFDPTVNAQEQQLEMQAMRQQQMQAEQTSQGAFQACETELRVIDQMAEHDKIAAQLNTYNHMGQVGSGGTVTADLTYGDGGMGQYNDWIPK